MSLSIKKVGSVSVIAVALFTSSWGAHATTANASGTDVNFTASVVGSTCTAEWDAAKAVSVDLGKVAATDLADAGDVGSQKPFTLKLKGCANGVTQVNVTASGTADTTDDDAFVNTATGSDAATGVEVTLFGGADQKTQLKPDGLTGTEYAVTDNAASMTFLTKLVRSSSGELKNGQVSSTATLNMNYE